MISVNWWAQTASVEGAYCPPLGLTANYTFTLSQYTAVNVDGDSQDIFASGRRAQIRVCDFGTPAFRTVVIRDADNSDAICFLRLKGDESGPDELVLGELFLNSEGMFVFRVMDDRYPSTADIIAEVFDTQFTPVTGDHYNMNVLSELHLGGRSYFISRYMSQCVCATDDLPIGDEFTIAIVDGVRTIVPVKIKDGIYQYHNGARAFIDAIPRTDHALVIGAQGIIRMGLAGGEGVVLKDDKLFRLRDLEWRLIDGVWVCVTELHGLSLPQQGESVGYTSTSSPLSNPAMLKPDVQYPAIAGLFGGVSTRDFIAARGSDAAAMTIFTVARYVRWLSWAWLIYAAYILLKEGRVLKLPSWMEAIGVTYPVIALSIR